MAASFKESLWTAINNKDMKTVRTLVTKSEVLDFLHQDVFRSNSVEPFGSVIFHSATQPAILEELLRAGTDPNAVIIYPDGHFLTLLASAIKWNFIEAVPVLLSYGASVEKTSWHEDHYGSAIDFALIFKRQSIVHQLVLAKESQKKQELLDMERNLSRSLEVSMTKLAVVVAGLSDRLEDLTKRLENIELLMIKQHKEQHRQTFSIANSTRLTSRDSHGSRDSSQGTALYRR